MTFLNWIMLLGLAGIAIPILIHLWHRGKGDRIQWGAMRFLLASIAAQSRRIKLEEAILLALRCMAIALVAMAMARPFLPSRAGIPWALVLPVVLGAAVCAGVGAAMWSDSRLRRRLFVAVAVLLAVGGLAALVERRMQARWWSFQGGDRDIAVLIDASGSMRMERDGRTAFEHALEEARRIVAETRSADAISVFLAGPVPVGLVATPTSDKREVLAALAKPETAPVGGVMGVLEAMNAATAALAAGGNPNKKIVLLTDGQRAGWQVEDDIQWEFLAAGLRNLASTPSVVCRRLERPRDFANVAVADATFSRQLVGIDRPVRIDVTLLNTGSSRAQPRAVDLLVDGTNVASQQLTAEILPGAAETVRFTHQFTQPGRRVVTASVNWEDALPADNVLQRVLQVQDRLPVLIVDGAPSRRPLESAASFLDIALRPRGEKELNLLGRIWTFLHGAQPETQEDDKDDSATLMVPTVVPASDIGTITDLTAYRVVVLANVPYLPPEWTRQLADFVRQGGGLLVSPGDRAQPASYDEWTSGAGEPVLPARLVDRRVDLKTPERFNVRSFRHPALTLLADTQQSDADQALVKAFWHVEPDDASPDVRVCATFQGGMPFLVERRLGSGIVLLSTLMFDRHDSNLPSLRCFLPLVHELVSYLAAPRLPACNVRPGAEVAMELVSDEALAAPAKPRHVTPAAQPPDDAEDVLVDTPSGRQQAATVEPAERGIKVRFAATYEPGLHWFVFPDTMASQYASNLWSRTRTPFVVISSVEESVPTPLTDADIERLRRHVDIFAADTSDEMALTVSEETPGQELWKYLVIGALLALVGETGVSRWISRNRKHHTAQALEFGSSAESARDFRERAAEVFGTPTPGSAAAHARNHTHE